MTNMSMICNVNTSKIIQPSKDTSNKNREKQYPLLIPLACFNVSFTDNCLFSTATYSTKAKR